MSKSRAKAPLLELRQSLHLTQIAFAWSLGSKAAWRRPDGTQPKTARIPFLSQAAVSFAESGRPLGRIASQRISEVYAEQMKTLGLTIVDLQHGHRVGKSAA